MTQTKTVFTELNYPSPKDSDSPIISNLVDKILTPDDDGYLENVPFIVYTGSNFHAVLNDNYTTEKGLYDSATAQRLCVEDFPLKIGDSFKILDREAEEWEQYNTELVLLQLNETIQYGRKTYWINYSNANSLIITEPESLNLSNAEDEIYSRSEFICQAGRILRAFEASGEELIPTGNHYEIKRDFFEEWATEPCILNLEIHLKKREDGFHLDVSYKAHPRILHDGGSLCKIKDAKNFSIEKLIEREKQDLQRRIGARRPIIVKAKIKDDRVSESLDAFLD